jgi:hypothetical protein
VTGERRLPHDNKAGALKMPHEPLGDDLRHDLAGVVDARAAPKRNANASGATVTGVRAYTYRRSLMIG